MRFGRERRERELELERRIRGLETEVATTQDKAKSIYDRARALEAELATQRQAAAKRRFGFFEEA